MKIQDVTTKQELAIFLGIKYRTLTYLLYYKKPESYYVSFTIPKKDGTARCINAPTGILKNIQQKLASRLYDEQKKYYTNSNKIPQGFIKERSILTNADCHKHKKYIVNIDLENYFNSIHFGRVQGYFENNRDYKLSRDVAVAMAQLVCYQGCLPQGAPTSPVITNMICAIMDRKIIVVAKKYRVLYTRYADDMTFSTNDDNFEERLNDFLDELEKVINKSGFSINKKKTRFSKPSSRHEVTGLVVNQKVSIKREYYRLFRTLTDHLYKGEPILYQGRELTFSQLEGIAAFISHVYEKSNAPKNPKRPEGIARQIQQFLFYKHFYSPSKPVIVTEGKTDILYLKAALKKYYTQYPQLIGKDSAGHFYYKVTFLNKSDQLKRYCCLEKDGADTLKNIYRMYIGSDGFYNLYDRIYKKSNKRATHPIILIFDNEQKPGRPLKKFMEKSGIVLSEKELSKVLCNNLILMTIPLAKGMEECEIEDLFSDEALAYTINGKTFCRDKSFDADKNYGKEIFSKHIYSDYMAIDFSEFIPLLNELNKIIYEYHNL